MNYFSLFFNGKQYPIEDLSTDTSSNKTSVMAYNTLFDATGIHHSDTGLQIRPDIFLNDYFMLLFDLFLIGLLSLAINPSLITALLESKSSH
jgi:hypothetical protein